MRNVLVMMILAAGIGSAAAKLPEPAPEAAAAAAAAKEKTAWGEKVAAYKLCLAQDRTAKHYQKSRQDAPKQTVETPPCVDPGPFVPGAAAAAAPTAAPTPSPSAAAAPAQPAAPAKK